MTKIAEGLIQEQIEQKEKEIDELKDLCYGLKLKRIENYQKEAEGVKEKTVGEMLADGTYSSELDEEDDPSEVIRRCIAYKRESPFRLRNAQIKKDRAIPGIPTNNSVVFEEPMTKLQRYKGHVVNPDAYEVVDGKLYFKEPHEGCGGDILVTECGISGWDHGHAQCTKCGKNIGGWISGADGMPFYG